MAETNFTGEWVSTYSYHEGKDASRHLITFERVGSGLVGKSLSQDDESIVTLHLQYDAATKTLTGTWQEVTSLSGQYAGAVFHGALQLILNDEGTRAEGKWAGFNNDRTHVNTGEWKLERRQN